MGADAAPAALEAVHPGRQLRLLRSASWRFCLLLGGVTVGNQLAAVLISRTDDEHRRRLLVAASPSALDLGVLGVFKYYSFFVQQLADAVGPSASGCRCR